MNVFKRLLHIAGKKHPPVVAVVAVSPARCEMAVRYLRHGAPGVPIWLFCCEGPSPETAALCSRVSVHRNPLLLLIAAHVALWPRRVALSAGTWTGERGRWILKLAPFTILPYRTLFLNEAGDAFAGTFPKIWSHVKHRVRIGAERQWRRLHDGFLQLLCRAADGMASRFRIALQKTVGGEELSPSPRQATSGHLLVWRGPWNWRKLDQAARESTARWILFGPDPLDDALPLFQDPQAFSAARQNGFRNLPGTIFSRAPVRKLQPGEVCRVFAHASPLILVDREKLLALGIPRTRSRALAWLLIGWKAAAAGYRSYTLASTKVTEPRPTSPIAEARFAMRVLRDPLLRRLGPREPDLVRGDLTFHIGQSDAPQPATGRRRILVIADRLPRPAEYDLCRARSSQTDFDLACYHRTGEEIKYGELRAVFREVYMVERTDDEPSRTMQSLILHLKQEKNCEVARLDSLSGPGSNSLKADGVEGDLRLRMQQDWDRRARQNARCFVATERMDWNEDEFYRSGESTVAEEILNDMQNICCGKDPKQMRVLEIGCGAGRVTRALADVFGEVHGVDVSGEMVRQAASALAGKPNARVFQNNGLDLSALDTAAFDFAFSVIVFQHIPDRDVIENYVREVHRVLRPGTLFKFQVQGRTHFQPSPEDTWLGTPISKEDAVRMALQCGFEPRYMRGDGTEYFWLWYFKPEEPG